MGPLVKQMEVISALPSVLVTQGPCVTHTYRHSQPHPSQHSTQAEAPVEPQYQEDSADPTDRWHALNNIVLTTHDQ